MAAKSVNLKYQARCLAAQPSDERCSRWLAGTTALREQNEVRTEHLLWLRALTDTRP